LHIANFTKIGYCITLSQISPKSRLLNDFHYVQILIIALPVYALFVRRKSFHLWTCGSFKSANHKNIGSADRKLQIRKVSLSPRLRIRIRIGSGFNRVSGSGFAIRIRIHEGKMTYKSRKKFVIVHVLKFWIIGWPLLRAKGFFCNLDVLYGGLGIGKLQFLIQK
jgi:hypothetical protein